MRLLGVLSTGSMSLLLAGCWNSDSVTSQTIGGSVSGLSGAVTLVLNGGESRVVSSDGTFSFQTRLRSGAQYSVSISSQPTTQTCVVANGAGAVPRTAVANVGVNCATHEYSVGGTATGLNGTIELRNGDDVISLTSNGAFAFPSGVPVGSTYAVTVQTQPANQTCVVNRDAGTMAAGAIASVEVACTTNTFTVAGSLSGLVTGLVSDVELQLNGAETVTVADNGAFSFQTVMTAGTNYSVTVAGQPTVPAQTCNVGNGAGMGLVDVIDVTVTCALPTPLFAFLSYVSAVPEMFTVDRQTGALTSGGTTNTVVSIHQALSHDGRFLYTPDYLNNVLRTYAVDPATAALTELAGSPVATGNRPRNVAASADGRVYAVNQLSDSLSSYIADPVTGELTATSTMPTGQQPVDIALSPDGRFAYVFSFTSGDVQAFALDTNTAVGSYSAPGFGQGFAMDPRGKFLYVPGRNFNVIYSFAVDPDTGALTTANTPVAAGTAPAYVAVDPGNRFLYAVNISSNDISSYSIDPTSGALTQLAGSPVATTAFANSITIDPSGKFVYVTSNSSALMAYRIDASTGALTLTPGYPAATGPGNPISLTILAR